MNEYGYCPICNAPGVSRERRPNGNDTCSNGHTYPSASALVKLVGSVIPVVENEKFMTD